MTLGLSDRTGKHVPQDTQEPTCDGESYVSVLLGHRIPKYSIKYFSRCVCECSWVKWTFKLLDWVKQIAFCNAKGLNRTKRLTLSQIKSQILLLLLRCQVVSNSLWPMYCSMPGLSVPHHLLEFAQVHVHSIGDAIQPSYPLLPSSLTVFNPSQHQGIFQWVRYLPQMAKVLELQSQIFILYSW